VAIATAGVLWLTFTYGDFPWIALALAASFGAYGLVRKLVGVPPVRGLGVESLYLFLPALAVLLWGEMHGQGGFIAHGAVAGWGWLAGALLVFGGVCTALPLIGFADAVRRIPFSLVGVPPVRGLGVESLYLFLPALAVLLWGEFDGQGGFVAHGAVAGWGWVAGALLVFGGVCTALPLIGFADAVRRIPFSLVGLLQYIAPTLQLLCGVLVLHEAFDRDRAIGFAFIWLALVLYAGDGLVRASRTA
jgi:chloramphenicol-sensitive protein RarD